MIHIPHLKDSQKPKQQRIKKHQDTVTEALLDRIQIVGIKTHKVSYFIDLIILLREHAAVIKHPVSKIRFHTDCRTKKTDSPEKTAKNHGPE